MPFYEYKVREGTRGCPKCAPGFTELQRLADPPLKTCPRCGAPVARQISAPAIGRSKSGFDDRAKAAGFHKLERRGKGEYEKKY
ncbi:MAG: zinc ribbon domain-containing protein [Lentisphaerae bacterium]|nr:zinc ribbon domain-containing protein [Lentisphaerota bacterium]